MTQPSTPPSSLEGEDEFDAGTAVPEIKWNLTKFCGPEARGVTPEPSDRQIKKLIKSLQKLMLELGVDEEQAKTGDMSALVTQVGKSLETSDDLDEDAYDKMMQAMCDIVGEFASHKPSSEQIMMLPVRVRMAFFGWFMGHFGNPESSAGA